jgi:hypothetical protein
VTTPLAHVPRLQCGETLSSLLLRTAHNHSATAHEFCTLLWPGQHFWTRDIDRTASSGLVKSVSEVLGIEATTLHQSTLPPLAKAFGFEISDRGIQRGILPVGVFHRIRRRYGQQYCPRCLAIRPHYLRRMWRLEFLVSCPVHSIRLRDACPHCGAPFIPHRAEALSTLRCHQCTLLLTECENDEGDNNARKLQDTILSALGTMLPDAGDLSAESEVNTRLEALSSAVGIRRFADGIDRLSRLAHNQLVKKHRGCVGNGVAWSLSRTADRERAMSFVASWLFDWPTSWTVWANTQGLSQHQLQVEYGPWPDWLAQSFFGIPYSFGPTHIRRRRIGMNFKQLRRTYPNVVEYRQARANTILKRAGLK